jgi:hypothetical protein
MFNPNLKIKLDKPLKLGNMRKNRRGTRKNTNIQTNPLGRPISIVFCLPGTPFSNKFLLGWTHIVQYCTTHQIQLMLSNRLGSNVYYVRNKCLGGNVQSGIKQKPFGGKLKYDYMMWIDSDQVFSVQDFEKLLAAKKDIVSGLYLMDGGDRYATVPKWDKEFYKKNGYFEFLNPSSVKKWIKENPNKLMEVEYTGFGWILIKKGVFESLEYPWFRPVWEDFGLTKDGFPIKEFSSEDVGWCQNILKNGFKIYIDPTVQVGHEKMVNYILPEYQKKLTY